MLQSFELDTRRLTLLLPIEGMTTHACARHVEAALHRQPGVLAARVDRTSARATLRFDPERTDFASLARAVREAGYEIVESVTTLPVEGIDDGIAAARLARALNDVPGVIAASVRTKDGKAEIRTVADAVAPKVLHAAIAKAGFHSAGNEAAAASDEAPTEPGDGLLAAWWQLPRRRLF